MRVSLISDIIFTHFPHLLAIQSFACQLKLPWEEASIGIRGLLSLNILRMSHTMWPHRCERIIRNLYGSSAVRSHRDRLIYFHVSWMKVTQFSWVRVLMYSGNQPSQSRVHATLAIDCRCMSFMIGNMCTAAYGQVIALLFNQAYSFPRPQHPVPIAHCSPIRFEWIDLNWICTTITLLWSNSLVASHDAALHQNLLEFLCLLWNIETNNQFHWVKASDVVRQWSTSFVPDWNVDSNFRWYEMRIFCK